MLRLKQIDARGMSCPQPVLMTKKAIEAGCNKVQILVDNNTAKSNVERFLKNLGYKINIMEKNDEYIVEGTK